MRALAYRALAKQGTGRPNPELAMLPLATREVEQQIYLVGVESLGTDGLDLGLGWATGVAQRLVGQRVARRHAEARGHRWPTAERTGWPVGCWG